MGDVERPNADTETDAENSLGFYSWNVQENRVFGDEVIAFVFGISSEDLAAGAPIEEVIKHVNDGDRQRLAKAIHEAILSGRQFESRYSITHPDGRKVNVLANGRCLRDSEGLPSIYSGTISIEPEGLSVGDPLERHCRAALGLANGRCHALAARYISSALNALPK